MFPPWAPFFLLATCPAVVGLPPGEARLRPRPPGHRERRKAKEHRYNSRPVAGSSNGRTLGSGPSSLGSNPSPAASLNLEAIQGHQALLRFGVDVRDDLDVRFETG